MYWASLWEPARRWRSGGGGPMSLGSYWYPRRRDGTGPRSAARANDSSGCRSLCWRLSSRCRRTSCSTSTSSGRRCDECFPASARPCSKARARPTRGALRRTQPPYARVRGQTIHVAAAATTRPVVISTQVARRLGAAGATRAARGGLPPPHGRVGRRVDRGGLRGGARGAARAFADRRLLRGNQRILTGTMRFGYCAGRRYRGPASSRGGGGAAHRKAGSRTVPTTRPPRHRRGPRRRNGRPAGPAGGDGGVAERGRWQLTCI